MVELQYKIVEETRTTATGEPGRQRITVMKLRRLKPYTDLTADERRMDQQIDLKDDVPEDAQPGEIYTAEAILLSQRPRTNEEREALDRAMDSGENVTISEETTNCNDPERNCTMDIVERIATPDGLIETRRTHTY